MAEALRRNVFAGGAGDAEGLALRVTKIERRLEALDLDAILGPALDKAISETMEPIPGERPS
jgi:hypothetical protein